MRVFCSLLLFCLALPAQAQLAVRGGTVYPISGDPIPDGVVLVRDGQIERVGPAASTPIPSGYQTLEAAVVTPGLVDARSTVGLSGILNQSQDQDQLDPAAAIQPELRALDAYNARDPLVEWLRRFGVTTVHTGHAPGALAAGQTFIIKTDAETVEEALVPEVMIAMTVGEGIRGYDTPGTRAKGMAMLREQLYKAQARREQLDEGDDLDPDLALDALVALLRGERTALVTAHRYNDILTALRLQREFGFPMVLDGGAETYLVLDEIAEAGVPVFLHPTMARQSGVAENASFETAARLAERGIPFAFQSGFEAYVPKTRVVLFEAGVAAAHGLDYNRALRALTLDAARLLGIEARVGSLEPGKDADLVLWDGDPLEYTTHACTVVIDGEIVSDTCR